MSPKENIVNFSTPSSEDIPSVEPMEAGNIVYFSSPELEQDTLDKLLDMRVKSKCFNNVRLTKAFGEFEGEHLSVLSSAADGAHDPVGTWEVELFDSKYILSWMFGQKRHNLYVHNPESERGLVDKQTDRVVMNILHRALILDEKTKSQMSKSRPRLKEIGRIGLGRRSRTLGI